MLKFKLSLLAAAVIGLSGSDAGASELKQVAGATPKVIADARLNGLTVDKPARTPHKPAKALRLKSLNRMMTCAKLAEASDDDVIYTCSFDFLTEGSETAPAPLELDDWDNIPEEIIGEENYGFGGQGLMQAGGAVYIPFEYPEDPDDTWYLEGMLWTPDIYEPMDVTIELDAKIVDGCGVDTDELWVYASDYSQTIDNDSGDISTDWTHLTLKIDAKDFVPESDDDSYYFTIFAEGGADILIKDVVIKGEKAELQVPVAEGYTDFTGSSFTAHWSEVAGATGYYLTVYNFDIVTNAASSVVLDAQYTENNYYTVTDLTPGDFYVFRVAATNGSFTTSQSNFVVVCELPSPTEIKLTASADNKSINATWAATPGANYYVLEANSTHRVTAGQTVMLADADFSGVQSTGSVAHPEESEYWYESLAELPGWQFNLGCSAPGAFGFWDNTQYTAQTGLLASLSSMDYDLSNIKDGKVNVSVEAASPGNGMLAGILTFNAAENSYDVASAYGTEENIPEDFETYTFDLTGANDRTQFLFMTRTANNSNGAVLIRKLQISGIAEADGTVEMPVASIQTAATDAAINIDVESGVTYSVVVVPYLVDNKGNILAVGRPSDAVTFNAETSGIVEIDTDEAGHNANFFNLQGQRIDNPEKGTVVIKVVGNKATKVVF